LSTLTSTITLTRVVVLVVVVVLVIVIVRGGMTIEPKRRTRHTRPMEWDSEAEARVKKAPFFVRPFIRSRAEREAKARGLSKVTSTLLDELKSNEHKGS